MTIRQVENPVGIQLADEKLRRLLTSLVRAVNTMNGYEGSFKDQVVTKDELRNTGLVKLSERQMIAVIQQVTESGSPTGLYSPLGHAHLLEDISDAGSLAALDTVGTSHIDVGAVVEDRLSAAVIAKLDQGETAYGWGNHAGLYSLLGHGHVEGDISDLDKYTQGQVDALLLDKQPRENGFVNRTDSSLGFDAGTRTFTISPTGADFVFYANGAKYTKSAPDNVVIPDTEGIHFIFYDNSGVLSSTTTFVEELITTNALVSVLYWNATGNEVVLGPAEERHGCTMDSATHIYNHNTRGCEYGKGILVGDVTADGDGDDNTHAQITVSSGSIWDEDIQNVIPSYALGAAIPFLYKSGATGDWRKAAGTGLVAYNGGSGRAQWNEWTGSTWQLTEADNNDFVLMHLYATNSVDEPLVFIIGQGEYDTTGAARAAAPQEIFTLETGGMVIVEFKAIASFIIQTSTGYANDAQSRIRTTGEGSDYLDWRGVNSGVNLAVSGVVAQSMADLTDTTIASLAEYDHLRYQNSTWENVSDLRVGSMSAYMEYTKDATIKYESTWVGNETKYMFRTGTDGGESGTDNFIYISAPGDQAATEDFALLLDQTKGFKFGYGNSTGDDISKEFLRVLESGRLNIEKYTGGYIAKYTYNDEEGTYPLQDANSLFLGYDRDSSALGMWRWYPRLSGAAGTPLYDNDFNFNYSTNEWSFNAPLVVNDDLDVTGEATFADNVDFQSPGIASFGAQAVMEDGFYIGSAIDKTTYNSKLVEYYNSSYSNTTHKVLQFGTDGGASGTDDYLYIGTPGDAAATSNFALVMDATRGLLFGYGDTAGKTITDELLRFDDSGRVDIPKNKQGWAFRILYDSDGLYPDQDGNSYNLGYIEKTDVEGIWYLAVKGDAAGGTVTNPPVPTGTKGENEFRYDYLENMWAINGSLGIGNVPVNFTQLADTSLYVDDNAFIGGNLTAQTLTLGTNYVGTATDIQLSSNANIAAEANLNFYIDSDDSYTANEFVWYHNSANTTGAEELMSLSESGLLTLNGDAEVDALILPNDGTSVDGRIADYEEGTWSPELGDSSGNVVTAYTTQQGHYVRVGNSVTVQIRIKISSKGSLVATSGLRIYGIPFDAGVNGFTSLSCSFIDGVSLPGNYPVHARLATTSIYLGLSDSTTGLSSLLPSEITDSFEIRIGGSYIVT